MSWTSVLNKNRFSVPNPIFANMWFCMRGCACRHIISDKWSNLSLFSLNAVLIFLQTCSGREKPNGWICSTVGTSGWPKNTRRLVSDKQTCVYPQVLFLFLNSSNSLANALMFIKRSTTWCYLRNLTAHLALCASKFTNCLIESDKVMTRPTQNIRRQNSLLYNLYWPLATHAL